MQKIKIKQYFLRFAETDDVTEMYTYSNTSQTGCDEPRALNQNGLFNLDTVL